MTYEQFKQYAIDYAEKSPYPSLTNKWWIIKLILLL
jgi:hypothetical protein